MNFSHINNQYTPPLLLKAYPLEVLLQIILILDGGGEIMTIIIKVISFTSLSFLENVFRYIENRWCNLHLVP